MTDETTEPGQDLVPARQRVAMVTGAPVSAFVPKSLDEAFRLANAMHLSGLSPSSLSTPEKVMVAIMAGAELGLPPFQSVQSFAVINGRPSIWGDGMLAVVRSRGFRIREWMEGEADGRVAFCEVIRPDTGEVITRRFSVSDAKTANLWSKAGPWQTNPSRMLQMRARAFACRDGAADILRGFQMREEVEDYAKDVTPAGVGIAARLAAQTGQPAEGFNNRADEVLATVEVIGGEDQPPRKRRRTKLEMAAARAAEVNGEPAEVTGEMVDDEDADHHPMENEEEVVEAEVEEMPPMRSTIEPDELVILGNTIPHGDGWTPMTNDASDITSAEPEPEGEQGEEEPSPVTSADSPVQGELALFHMAVANAGDFASVRAAVAAFRGTEDYKQAEVDERRSLLAPFVARLDQLRAEDPTVPGPASSTWVFSSWLFLVDPAEIAPVFAKLQETEDWANVAEPTRDGIMEAIRSQTEG